MFADFYVFSSPFAGRLIQAIEDRGYNVYYRKEYSAKWKIERFTNENRFRFYSLEYDQLVVSDTCPLLCISVEEDYDSWENVNHWVQTLLGTEPPNDLDFEKPPAMKREYIPLGESTIIDGKQAHVLSIPPDDVDLKNGYSFNSFYDSVFDVKYYEVIAPSSETPFTVVVYNFSKRDDSWFFTDIFASSAWACNQQNCRYDIQFLCALWKHLGLVGEFNFELLKRRVDSCYPDRVKNLDELNPEPSVYRRPMADVIEMKRKRRTGE